LSFFKLKNIKLADGAIIIAVITAALYAFSMAEYNGFLYQIELDPNVLERSFHLTVYSGMVKLYLKIFILFLILIVSIFIIYIILIPLIALAFDKLPKKTKKFLGHIYKKYKGDLSTDSHTDRLAGKAVVVIQLLSAILLILVGILLSLRSFEIEGENRAKKKMDTFFNGNYKKSSIINKKIDGVNTELGFLACGSENCAAIDLKTKIIYYFKQDSGYSFKYSK